MFKGAFQSQKDFKVWLKKKLQKSFFNQKYSSVLIKTGTEELFLTLCGKVLHGVDASKKNKIKPAFVNCSLAFSYPSDSLIGFAVRCYWLLRYSPFLWLNVAIALHYFTTMNWNFPFQPKKVSQKLLQYSMCSNKGVFLRKWDTYIKRLSRVLDDMEYFAYLHADVIATSLFHIHCRSW